MSRITFLLTVILLLFIAVIAMNNTDSIAHQSEMLYPSGIESSTDGAVLDSGEHIAQLNALRFSQDSHKLAVLYFDGTVHIWDTTTQSKISTAQVGYYGRNISFAPDGRTVAVSNGSRPGYVNIIDVSDGRIIQQIKNGSVYDVAFMPDGKSVIVADWSALHVYDVASGEVIFQDDYRMGSVDFTLSDDGHMLAVALGGGGNVPLMLYDTASWERIAAFGFFTVFNPENIAITSDNATMATSSDDSISVWDIGSLTIENRYDPYLEPMLKIPISDNCANNMDYVANDSILIIATCPYIEFRSMPDYEIVYAIQGAYFAISEDETQFALVDDSSIQLWQAD